MRFRPKLFVPVRSPNESKRVREPMRISMPYAKRVMIRLLGTVSLITMICLASDCQAQIFRGRLMRGVLHQNSARQMDTRLNQNRLGKSESSPRLIQKTMSRYFDPRNLQSMDPGSGNPRYIGGFHYTHFQNIGIPSGDIGLRGNAYHWRPW